MEPSRCREADAASAAGDDDDASLESLHCELPFPDVRVGGGELGNGIRAPDQAQGGLAGPSPVVIRRLRLPLT